MKIKNRPYEKDSLCHGCKKTYLINEHLLECQKIKILNEDKLAEIKDNYAKYELDYKTSDIFEDYGLKNLVKKVRQRVEHLKIEKHRSNSIIKEPFENFPENGIIAKITKLISNWLIKIDKDQEITNKNRK